MAGWCTHWARRSGRRRWRRHCNASRKPHPSFTAAVQRSREESWRSMLLEGIAAYSAHSTSSTTGLTVGMGMPAESVDAQTRRSFLALSAAGAATLAGGLILALI